MTDTNAQTTIALSISHEELMFLLSVLRIPVLPGMEENEVQNFLVPENESRLAAAQHSLQARDLITVDADGTVTVDQTVGAMLLNCAASRASLAVFVGKDRAVTSRSFYDISPYFIVEHSDPMPGVHRFVPLENLQVMAEYMLAQAGVAGQTAPPEPEHVSIDPRWLPAHREALNNGQPGAEALVAAGADESVAYFLDSLLQNVDTTHVFVGSTLRENAPVRSAGFSLLKDRGGALWLVRDTDPGKAAELVQVGAVEVARQLLDVLRTIVPDLVA